MWSADSERFMSWPRTENIREAICQWAGRYTNRNHSRFNFDRGMSGYALVYFIDVNAGRSITPYALSVISHWGRRFPFAMRIATNIMLDDSR